MQPLKHLSAEIHNKPSERVLQHHLIYSNTVQRVETTDGQCQGSTIDVLETGRVTGYVRFQKDNRGQALVYADC